MNAKIFWLFWGIVICLFAFFVPPFQKPDEPVHFYRAMALARGEFSCTTSSAGLRYFPLPKTVYDFPSIMLSGNIVMHFDTKFPIGLYKTRYPFVRDRVVTDVFQSCELPVLPYIPFALAALLSLPFNNLLVTFFAMRVGAALFFIGAVYIGFRCIPKKYRLVYFFLMANPMIIHQATSVSYDAILNILIFLIFSFWLRVMEQKKVSWVVVGLLLFILLLACLVKPGYYLMLALIAPIVTRVIKKNNILYVCIGSLLILIVLFFTPSIHSIFYHVFLTSNSPQPYIVFHDPWYFFTVIFRTLIETQNQLTEGLVGLFGWLDYRLPLYVMFSYVFIGGMISYEYIRNQTKTYRGWVIVFLGLVCLGSVLLIYYLFYRAATPSAYRIVEGIQGRYFLPLLPFGMIFTLELAVWIKLRKQLFVVLGFLGIVCVGVIGFIIYGRYYDYSRNFSNPDELVKEVANKNIDLQSLSEIEVKSPMSFVYPSRFPGYKIGGIQMISLNELSVDVPYRVYIKDSLCKKILYSGYLNELRNIRLAHLRGANDVVITQYISITAISDDKVCFVLEPFSVQLNSTYLRLLGKDSQPEIRFLYIAK